MSVEKKYAIVCFCNDTQVEVVPSSWLIDNKSVKWPANCSLNTTTRLIRDNKEPGEDWNVVAVRILGFSKTFKNANHKATLAQDTSNIGLDSSLSEVEDNRRKRVRPQRFESSTEDVVESPRAGVKKKIFLAPKPPILREMQSSATNIVDDSQESLSVSLISTTNVHSTPHKGNPTIAMFTRVFKCLESIQDDLKKIKADQCKIQCLLTEYLHKKDSTVNNIFTLPAGISIPTKSDEELIQLNCHLKEDKSLIAGLARYLHGIGNGKTVKGFLLSIAKKVLTKNVALLYSRLGRKGKKPFEALEGVYGSFLAAAAMKFQDVGKEEMAEKFSRVLASACDWDGTRIKKHIACPNTTATELGCIPLF